MTKVYEADITDFVLDDHNANRGTERGSEEIEQSLRDLGAGRSIVVDRAGKIPAGNKTVQAAVKAGITKAIVIETEGDAIIVHKRNDWNLDDPDVNNPARQYAYRDNLTQVHSFEIDPAQVKFDLDAGMDLSAVFETSELDAILAELEEDDPPDDPGAQIDKGEELAEKYGTALGQIWQIGEHRLAVGDCTDAAVVAGVMDEKEQRFDLLVTDPPYGVSYADKNKFLNTIARGNRIQTPIEGDHKTPGEMSHFWRTAFSVIRKFARPGACYYVTGPQGGDLLLLLLALRESGFPLRHMLIWAKNNHVLGRSDYNYKHEPILYGWVKGAGHKFYGPPGETSLWEIPKPHKSDLHPTMKPIELYERAIQNSTTRGEVVLDPFVGSGTALVACENTGRKCRACEISPACAAVTLERMSGLGLTAKLIG